MGKSTHSIGQLVLGQLISYVDKRKVLKISELLNCERYVVSVYNVGSLNYKVKYQGLSFCMLRVWELGIYLCK
ncbi:MAG: hypothetical protein ACK5L5_07265 [Bacteroidales bacterium]